MKFITLDFETYYDQDYSLSKMTTEAYIRDPRFEIIGMSWKWEDSPASWKVYDPKDIFWLSFGKLDWSDTAILCHHTAFDGAILSWHFGVKPRLWLDTLSMARPIHRANVGLSLRALAKHYGLGEKGDEVIAAKGVRRAMFYQNDLDSYGRYCCNDVELTFGLFNKLKLLIPAQEIRIIDQNIRMFTEPKLDLDPKGLQLHLESEIKRKEELLKQTQASIDDIRSNVKLATYLQSLGVNPPKKTSRVTQLTTWAFAKTDKAFLNLLEHEDERVRTVVAARLGVRSSIEQTRTESLLGVSGRGKLPIMLHYYGGHTGRDSGGDNLNLQNLPRNGAIRRCILAPPGFRVLSADLSQIEARITAWLAGEWELVNAFADKSDPLRDVYTKFASDVYGRDITKEDRIERFVGKTCILGLGFGMSHIKLQQTLATGAGGIKVDLTDSAAFTFVNAYRTKYPRIPKLWTIFSTLLGTILNKREAVITPGGLPIRVTEEGIWLPNGMCLRYELLTQTKYGMAYSQASSQTAKYAANLLKGHPDPAEHFISIHGAKAVENDVQALANIITKEASLRIGERYPVVFRVHDEVVCLIPNEEELDATEFVNECMTTPPDWAKTLPLECEIGIADNYGDV